MLNSRSIFSCFARTWCIGAAMTTRGMQHIGLLYALNPALTALYKDPQALAAARSRYLPHCNVHPFMAALFVGILIHLEQHIAHGRMPCQAMDTIIRTTATTLSALGDSFFSGTLLVLWALATSVCIVTGYYILALGVTLLIFIGIVTFRIGTFILGVRRGIGALQWIRQVNLINWSGALKLVNALCIAGFLLALAAQTPHLWWGHMLGGMLCVACGAFLINRIRIPRLFLLGTFLVLLYCGVHPTL